MFKESAAALDARLGTHTLIFFLHQHQAADNMIVRQVKHQCVIVDALDDPEAMPPRQQHHQFPPN
jgi:hypothetical protein